MSQSERIRLHSQHSSDHSELFVSSTSSSTSRCIPKTINLEINTLENDVNVVNDANDSTSNSSTASSSSSSSNISSILTIDNRGMSPLRLSQHESTSNFTFNLKRNKTKLHRKSNSIDVLLTNQDNEELDGDQTRSASQPPLNQINHHSSFSISTFLRNEMEYIDIAATPIMNNMNNMDDSNNKKPSKKPIIDLKTIDGSHSAEERIYNFFWLFFTLEKLLFFGFWICFDSFLLMITILPTRVLYRIYIKLSYLIKNEWVLLYYINIKYHTMYYFYTFKYCFIVQTIIYIVSLQFIKDLLLYTFCCKKSISISISTATATTTKTTKTNINNGEYKEYFSNQYNCCCKLLCVISCCCIFNRNIYYNRDYERKLLLLTKEEKEEKEENEEKEDDLDREWLLNLKQEIYDKRIEFLNNRGFGYIYTGRDYLDIIRLLTLFLCVYILTQFNLSQIYHFIRAQENFKLYVLFKIIVIIEHLLSSFGEDSIESLFKSLLNDKSSNKRRIFINLLIYIFYNIIHSLLLYGHLITLNAAMNSPNNTLITILVADNFYELKSTVFRKYQIENVFQMLCSDIVERFTIFLFVLLILLQNLCYLGWDNFDAEEWFIDAFQLFLIMVGFEIIVDTIKHGFICKFNNLSINIYKSFYIRLSMDFTNARRMNEGNIDNIDNVNKSFFMDRRLGFSSLPLVTLFLRVMWQISEYNNNHKYVKIIFIIFSFIIVYLFKLLLSLIMIAKSIKKLKKYKYNQQYLIAKQLANVRRYALFVKKIPI